ncbi:hypothetical protein HIM_06567 [Hirsutella minnesotensis 3608]|uniref:Uncharacterized protein n=1 Tax=Hirsutella minnesotensis 3608 TaxID=1043627 RepID=A0A0F7ZU24_9HYPO|nr:hypothetical protein HIM_06567 [Hirsutella minnesotensis 3608]
MPALSPTMTEGNIAAWKVRDGQAFSAGDVLLEIETDKATMDVEAQDDGVMFRVLAPDGSKAVQVGARIAVVADQGDDVNALEMPPDDTKPAAADGQSQPEARATKDARETGTEQPQAPRRAGDSSASSGQAAPARRQSDVRYPLMPAVEHLVKQNGLSEADVRGITPTGPNGRLLKGDVLAYLGTINADAPPEQRQGRARHGLDKVKAAAGGSRGVYLPQISAVPPPSMLAGTPAPARRSRKAADVFDEIVAPSRKAAPTARKQPTTVPGMSSGANVFSLVVPKGEERRAQVFLERCKLILEEEPGRLVL